MLGRACRDMSPAMAERLFRHVLAHLGCVGTHTITGLLTACGRQFEDWTADYRMYAKERMEPERLFDQVRHTILEHADGPVVVGIDDTRVRKAGKKTYGVNYTRDPLGPPFHVNFIRAQRFVQTSMAWKSPNGQARMIPVDWLHAPLPPRPHRNADESAWSAYRKESERCRISRVGATQITTMRQWMDRHAPHRPLWTVVDGSYTNKAVMKTLPPNTTLVGRVRKDASLYFLPETVSPRGRHRVYGPTAPTPEQLRKDETIPWKNVQVFYGGNTRTLRIKSLAPLRWRVAGEHVLLKLLVIAPTPYFLRKGGKTLYRNPAYLICTDPDADDQLIVQHYLWRWDMEVNFRDQKTIMGVGEAQVRTKASVQLVTACAVAAYALLLVAAASHMADHHSPLQLPSPKWQRHHHQRPTTTNLIQNLRLEMCSQSIYFSGFAFKSKLHSNPQKLFFDPVSSFICSSRYS